MSFCEEKSCAPASGFQKREWQPVSRQRLKGLDVLRGIAIILVLLHHHSSFPPFLPGFGWIGVDLFFALSGFLVAGLLFSDFVGSGAINVRVFILRRGLKILPSFLFLILVTISVEGAKSFFTGTSWGISPQRVFSELFFLQSYCGGLFVHTWSLAVEVHFYVFLLLVVYMGLKWFPGQFIKYFPIGVAVIMLSCLLLRINVNVRHAFDFWSMVTPTHLRIDSLWLGSLIAYYYYFKRQVLICFVTRYKKIVVLIAAAAFAVFGMRHTDVFFTYTIGLTLLSIGFCSIVVLTLCGGNKPLAVKKTFLKSIAGFAGFIGVHSYSIYLWHMFIIKYWFGYAIHHHLMAGINAGTEFVLYFTLCIVVGVAVSLLVEMPVLAIRDRVLPRRPVMETVALS